jgi:hypothetical protein
MKRRTWAVGIMVAAGLLLAAVAGVAGRTVEAAKPDNPECWGVVVSQRATTYQDIGAHSSSQEEPRLGLGNFARLLFELGLSAGPHISDAATVAALLDDLVGQDPLGVTQCP